MVRWTIKIKMWTAMAKKRTKEKEKNQNGKWIRNKMNKWVKKEALKAGGGNDDLIQS